MKDFYKFIANKEELEYFYNYVIASDSKERTAYQICLSLRSKNLSKEEIASLKKGIAHYGLFYPKQYRVKKENTFEDFINILQEYEVRKGTFGIDEKLEQKSFTLYMSCNPSSDLAVANAIGSTYNESSKEAFLAFTTKKDPQQAVNNAMSLPYRVGYLFTSKGCTENKFIHLDFDFRDDLKEDELAIKEAGEVIINCGNILFGKESFLAIRTKNGIHVIIKESAYGKAAKYILSLDKDEAKAEYGLENGPNPTACFIYAVEENYSYTFQEPEKGHTYQQNQCFVPIPGIFQYGDFEVKILNKIQ